MEDNVEEGCVLLYDTDAGEGEIELIDSFQKQSVLMTPLDLQSI